MNWPPWCLTYVLGGHRRYAYPRRKTHGCAERIGTAIGGGETVELSLRRFNGVDVAFAYDEGEGDRSLEYWRGAHRRYFTRMDQYAEDMWLYCGFRLVERIDVPGEAQHQS